MTLPVLRSATNLNLRSIRNEVRAAFEEKLICEPDFYEISLALELLSSQLKRACDLRGGGATASAHVPARAGHRGEAGPAAPETANTISMEGRRLR